VLNVGPAEFLIIGLVLLIAVGPEQLPSVIRKVGQTVGQLRSMTDGLRSEFMAGLEELERNADLDQWRSAPSTSSNSNSKSTTAAGGSPNDSEAENETGAEAEPRVDAVAEQAGDPGPGEEPPGDPAGER
jgi:sec-independent protein translocase protein TatB